LSQAELQALKAEIKETGYMTIQQVREILETNTTMRFTGEGIFVLDPDIIMQLDMRLDKPIFIMPDNTAMTREELMCTFPFAEMQTTPERIFAQQEVGVFPVRESNLDQVAKEYLARDMGSDDEFVMFEDVIGREARKAYKDRRPIEKVVKTKVFLAREGWEDFMALAKHIRAIRRIVGGAAGFGGALMGGGQSQQALEDAAGVAKRLEQQEQEMAAREERMQERQAAFEEQMRKKQEELEAQTQKLTDLLAGL